MTTGSLVWLIVFAISVAVFFCVAAVVSVKGFSDLLDLLRPPDKGAKTRSDKL